MQSFFLKGTFLDAPVCGEIRTREGFLLIKEGQFGKFYDAVPTVMYDLPVYDYSGKLILPGMTDLHLHAPQYCYAGMAMDLELLDWLQNYTYPEEARYKDPAYAKKGYSFFVRDLISGPATRAVIFATLHTDATLVLMDQLEEAGFPAYAGKLAMNRNSPDYYREPTTEYAIKETLRWIDEAAKRNYRFVKPILTPRFTPSVTDDYMAGLGEIAREYHLPMQSHLSENTDEIRWVAELCPDTDYYAESYAKHGLFGGDVPTVMAHCIYCPEEENALIHRNGVMIAHCPTSNENVIAGICPAAGYLRNGYHIGIGSDVAGGNTLNLFEVVKAAVQVSKLRWKYVDNAVEPLTLAEAFYMATAGGGQFFGKVGILEEGYDADAIVVDDAELLNHMNFTPAQRLERYSYIGNGKVFAKFILGNKII